MASSREGRPWLPFLAGALAGAAGAVLYEALVPRRGLDPRLVPGSREDPGIPPAVLVPGILGSGLLRPDGSEAWLNAGNAIGHHELGLPLRLPLSESRDDLRPRGLVGVDSVLPRLFGFTEYVDLLAFLESAGFHRDSRPGGRGAVHHVFAYDWRRDIVESARRLGEALAELADAFHDRHTRFNVIAHSMGGLIARYYLRYGSAEPDPEAPVSWAGAHRIAHLFLVATPNSGGLPALDAILNGSRVGLSSTTLAASVVAGMPSIYALLPAPGTEPFLSPSGEPLPLDPLDPVTWESLGWGPFGPRVEGPARGSGGADARDFLAAALQRARSVHDALARVPDTACPARVIALGGDCLPTPARAVIDPEHGGPPRLEPLTPAEAERMLEAGDGRVTRASVLGSHLPGAASREDGCGLPEVAHVFFGAADHHGIYSEPTFQSLLLRALLRTSPRRVDSREAAP